MFTQQSMATAGFKKVLGIAHTDNLKGPGNEALRTGFSVAGSTVFSGDVPANPSKAALYDITNGVVEFVRLPLVADPTSNGKAFLATLPSNYQGLSSNAKKILSQFANNTKLSDTKGKVQVVPSAFAGAYEPIPYTGGTAAKGSGTVIPPMDARDWVFDAFNGVFFQQGSGGTDPTPSYIECFIWVGGFVTDELSTLLATIGSGSQTFVPSETLVAATDAYYKVDEQVPAASGHSVSKWYVSASLNGKAHITEVTGLLCDGNVAFNEYGRVVLQGPLFSVKVDHSGGNIRLLVKPSVAGLIVETKRLAVY